MSDNLEDIFSQKAPEPCHQAKEAAWQAAALEFHRSQHKRQREAWGKLRLWVPLAAAAVIAVCGVVFYYSLDTEPAQMVQAESHAEENDIRQLFVQGRELFGDNLEAVTISRGKVTWHVKDGASQNFSNDQLVILTLKGADQASQLIAATPGVPVPVVYQGQTREVEFLPDSQDQVIAVGDGVYWNSKEAKSPIHNQKIVTLTY